MTDALDVTKAFREGRELDRLLDRNSMLSRLVDKLSVERDAAVASREGIKRVFVDELLVEKGRTIAAEQERDALRVAIARHHDLLSAGETLTVGKHDRDLWAAAGLEP